VKVISNISQLGEEELLRVRTLSVQPKVTNFRIGRTLLQYYCRRIPENPKFAEFPNCEPCGPKFWIFSEEKQVKEI